MENIIRQIEENNWDAALHDFLDHFNVGSMDVNVYIVGATIMEHYQDMESLFRFITEGLKIDPTNYELYMLLGSYYSYKNPDQAYLSYENALYHSERIAGKDSDDYEIIRQTLNCLKENNIINVRNVSFVILSFNQLHHTQTCINSIRNTCNKSSYEIIVIDNASTDGSVEWLRDQSDITLIENKENAGFPKATNQGIMASDPSNDIFLLNNDTILMSESFFWLRIGLYENDSVGATGAVSNNVSKEQAVQTNCTTIEDFKRFAALNNVPWDNPYECKMYLVMFAMLIRRKSLEKTGLLDELYTPGNFEDNDYGLRLTQNGYNCILCHNSFIYHVGSASFGKDANRYAHLYLTNYNKFKNKWGFSSDEYSNPRNDIVDMIEQNANDEFCVLDIGCGFGETLTKIRYRYPNSTVNGIEINKTVADIAAKRLNIVCEDIESYTPHGKYDYIILCDILDCLKNPVNVLMKLYDNLNENGYVLASIPNAMNAEHIYDMLTGHIPFVEDTPAGMEKIHHFTINSVRTLVEKAGYTISDLYATFIPEKSTDEHREFFNEILKINGVASKEMFDINRYLLKLKIQRF